jgi:hypothetical protein
VPGRRIGGAGGGSDPGKLGAGGVIVAVGLAAVLGVGATTAPGGSAASGGAASSSSSGRSASRSSDQDSRAAVARLSGRGLRATVRLTDDGTDCAANSYGAVREFFEQHPCTALYRSVLEVRDREGDVVLLAIASVEMPDEDHAEDLKSLLDAPGSGNLIELSRERGRYQSVRYTGDAYASRREGDVVTNAQAQPVARGWSGLALTTIATNAVE